MVLYTLADLGLDMTYGDMDYDVLLETGTLICGRYLALANAASERKDYDFWHKKSLEIQHFVWDVNSNNPQQIREGIVYLADVWKALKTQEPVV